MDNDRDEEEGDEEDNEREKDSTKLQTGKRTHYSDVEDLDVVKAWVRQSEHSVNQKRVLLCEELWIWLLKKMV